VHAQARWTLPLRDRWTIDLAGGPSFFNLRQAVVGDVTVTQSYPYDTATLAGVVSSATNRTGVGLNAAADIDYLVSRRVGFGVLLGFSRARVKVPAGDGHDLKVDAGGPHVGVGIRLHF